MATSRETVDVLVIGAGASGAAFTWSLAESGIDVMCLEQGGEPDPQEFPGRERDWELHRQTDYHPDPNVRRLPEDYPVNNDESAVEPVMYNAVGGSTILYSAHFPRFHPSDFRVNTLDGVAADWPVTYEELEPHYDLNDRVMGVAGITGDPAYPPKSPRQTRPLLFGKGGDAMAIGFDRLGWHWWPSDSAILQGPYDGRQECNGGGSCDLGCSRRAKGMANVTYWPKALMRGALLETQARVREITVGRDGLADGAVYYDADGRVQFQPARIVVLACNGVGTPRLLLNSTTGLNPDGLANSTGLVGKNLMFHPISMVTGVFEQRLDGFKGPLACDIYSHEFYETDLSRGFVRGVGFQVLRGTGPVTTAIGGFGDHVVPWGEDHRSVFSEWFAHSLSVAVLGEDLPEPDNRVTLDPDLADSDGIPAPKIEYKLSDNSLKMMEFGTARAVEAVEAAGANDVLVNPHVRTSGYHLMGTARMGNEARSSVVNEWGRAHDVKNLFIIDGSIFVTAAAVNPTSTIQALALYIADYIKQNSRHLLD
jgi:choline dehydrogenase-like flavoprotein